MGPRNSSCTPTVSLVREQFLCSITLHDSVVSPVTATIGIGQVGPNTLLCDDQGAPSPLNGDQRLQELSTGGGAILRNWLVDKQWSRRGYQGSANCVRFSLVVAQSLHPTVSSAFHKNCRLQQREQEPCMYRIRPYFLPMWNRAASEALSRRNAAKPLGKKMTTRTMIAPIVPR